MLFFRVCIVYTIRFKGKTRYNPDWEDPRLHPQLSQWIQSVNAGSSDDVFYFQYKVCKGGKRCLSNMGIAVAMGIAAAKKHMTDPKPDKKCKHNKRMEDLRSMKRDCFASKQSDNEPPTSSVSCSETILQSSNQSFAQSELKAISDEIWQSQTLWALNVVHTHQSLNSAGNKGDLFRAMFPDSVIAKEFNKLSRGKLSYMINHGLAPYFKNQIMLKLSTKAPRLPPKFTSSFDESLNTVSCSKQILNLWAMVQHII